VVVDDGSTDGTWDLVQGYRGLPLRTVRLPRNRGKGAAVKAGMLAARGDYRFFTDSDLPYDLSAVASAMQLFQSEACDLVAGARDMAGSRDAAGTSRARKTASRVFSAMTGMLFGFDIRDSQCGFKGFTAKAAESLFGACATPGYAFDVEILARARKLGLRVSRIPVTLLVNQDSSISLPKDGFVMLWELAAIYMKMKSLTQRRKDAKV
jgi:dolichyl-phosphate beta-glucosyltransferase